MFTLATHHHTVNIPAALLNADIPTSIHSALYTDVEGKTLNSTYILLVLEILHISEGHITLTGDITFKVKFKSLNLEIKNGMVVEAKIAEVNQMGLFAHIGPVSIFVSHYQIPSSLRDNLTVGSGVRLRVKGVRYENGISVVGTLNEEFLGVVL